MGGMLSMTADCDELEILPTEVGVNDPEFKMSGTNNYANASVFTSI